MGVDFLVTVIVTIVIFMVMITLHEFGHFIMAKTLGVNVLEFSVGMGPAVFKRKGKDTLYSLRALPIGGYCRLDGEDGGSDNPSAFCNQKLWKRFLVVSAGAILNLLLGFVLFIVLVGMMGPFKSNTIGKVDERAYLAQSGVIAGDKIVRINGHRVSSYNDISLYSNELKQGEEIELVVKRNGEKISFSVMPSMDETTVTYGETSAEYSDTINGVNETRTITYEADEIPEEYVGKTYSTSRYIIGFEPLICEVTAANIVPQAWHYTEYVAKSIYRALWDMISRQSGFENVSGPVGVAGAVNQAVHSGKESGINVLFLVAMLTINLGIFNLLPLPALDGGRLFFMLVELIRGKPVPPEKEGLVHAIGLVLLLILAAVICFNDILKLIP
ncbi:MAG: site-2 protease family protein [Clostridiales bacterium]|nr:site-2 protease family protein [Clostridiales bacterium]